MKEEFLCINSDSLNRYGYVFHITALEKNLKEVFDSGTPMLIGHDFHRPIGWNLPFGLFIEPRLARLISRKMVAENEEEVKKIHQALQNFLGKHFDKRFDEHGENFLPLLSKHLSGKQTHIDAGCIAIIDENILAKLFPDIVALEDHDGLITLEDVIKDFEYLSQGVFKHKSSDLCIYAHEFFRRSQSRFNSFHFFFLDAFIELSKSPDCILKIRLDRDMIGYAPSFHERGELAFHYGPPYTDDINGIKTGITRHVCTDTQRILDGISSTEFYWKRDGNEKIFELEELRDNPSPQTDDTYHCRYIHSIYDSSRQTFVHFDGAMRSYSFEQMMDRVDKDFVSFGKKTTYKKLFRIDGNLPLNKWKTLITHYMQGNNLIYEYFGMKEKFDSFNVESRELTHYEKLVPFDISKEEGLKLMVSYHQLPETLREGRYIDVYDVISDGDKIYYIVEHLLTEVKNAFRIIGENLDIIKDVTYVKFDDPFWNIPSIMHRGKNVKGMLQKSVEALVSLFKAMSEKGLQTIISLTLSFEFSGRLVRISSYGHIHHQLRWLLDNFPFEFSETGITNWVDNQRTYLNKFTESTNTPLLSSLLQPDGILFIKRKPVTFPYDYNEDDKGLNCTIQFPSGKDATLKLYNENKIRTVLCLSIQKAMWSDTKEDYFMALRSKWLQNENAHVEIHEATPLGLYWTKPS